MAADILHSARQHNLQINYNDDIFNECLMQINSIVGNMSNGRTLMEFGLPLPITQGPVLCAEYI